MAKNRVELDLDVLEGVNGGSLGFDPDATGTIFTMRCQYSGEVFYNIPLAKVIEIARFGATIPDTAEGEQQIIAWAKQQGII